MAAKGRIQFLPEWFFFYTCDTYQAKFLGCEYFPMLKIYIWRRHYQNFEREGAQLDEMQVNFWLTPRALADFSACCGMKPWE